MVRVFRVARPLNIGQEESRTAPYYQDSSSDVGARSCSVTRPPFPFGGYLSTVPTIAVLTDHLDYLGGGYASGARQGLEQAAHAHGLRLNFFVGHELGQQPECLIHTLAGPENAQGVVAMAAGLAAHRGLDAVQELLTSLAGLPLCSLGAELPGVTSVVADARTGLGALLDHLVVDHGRRHIAFLAGYQHNPDTQLRFSMYREALERHGLSYDSRRVVHGIVDTNLGRRATAELMGQGVAFDTLIAHNDAAAFGALEALYEHGRQVPDDVALTGFDDLTLCRFTHPPLTTIRQPVSKMAAMAIELVVAQMQGKPVPPVSRLPVEVVRRVSCGCPPALPAVSLGGAAERELDASSWFAEQHSVIEARICDKLTTGEQVAAEWARGIVDGLSRELTGMPGAFVTALQRCMAAASDRERTYDELLRAVEVLRKSFEGVTRHLEPLWTEAQRVLAVASAAGQMRHWIAVEGAYHSLVASGVGLSHAFDLNSLRQSLGEYLPTQVLSAHVSLVSEQGLTWLEPFFYMERGKILSSKLERFPATLLFPPDLELHRSNESWLVLPLAVEEEYLGVAVMELSGRLSIHEMLRSQISTALKSVSLHQQIVHKTAQHERGLQERLATTKRLQSLSVLAGGVAHDLNNALGPLVALPDIIIDQLRGVEMGARAHTVLSDLDLLKGAALRAAQTIKDLLALGRQGRMPKRALNLNRFSRRCIEVDQLLREHALRHGVDITCKVTDAPLVVSASEAQLQRAISNLLRNAIEAVPPGGRVTLSTRPCQLAQPLDAYETISAGDYAVLEVSDTGRGIDPGDLGRIFEPFFTNKPPSEHSGTGLGLAIVHGVIKEHHGFVNVESKLGHGTTFTLYFPRIERRADSDRAPPTASTGAGRLLVVDDDPVQLRTAQRVLTHFGYQVTVADDVDAARRHFAEASGNTGGAPFDLVIVDVVLGEAEDGLELFADMQRRCPSQKGLVVSGNAQTERVEQAIRDGVCFLGKPYRADELVEAVQAAVSGGTAEPTLTSG